MKLTTLLLALREATLLNCGSNCSAQTLLPNAFTYGGRLDVGGTPLTGTADVEFSPSAAPSPGGVGAAH